MKATQITALDLPGGRMPPAWIQADTLPVAFRACFLCQHGADEGIERVCTKPELQALGAPQPVSIVRAWGGACGPDALHHCEPTES